MQQPAESPKSANRGLALFLFFLNFFGIVLMVIWTPLRWLLRQVFGNLNWQAPAWLHWSARRGFAAAVGVRRHPRKALIGLAAVLLLAGGGWYGYHWWQARPKPVEVTFKAVNPGRTEIEQDDPANRLPKPLLIKFDHSAATLAAVGKDVSSGITVSPAIAGGWHWDDDKTLSFKPSEDWPVGREYKLGFDKQLFSPEIRLAQYDTTFSSAAFTLNIARTEFYQDPVNPAIKQAVVELHFSHPVNPVELEKRIELQLDQQSSGVLGIGKETTPFTATYDKLKLNAYIRSASLPIPKDGSRMNFTLAKGLTAARGSPASDQPLTAQIEVPGLYSLAISDMQPQVVTNDKNEPEQVLLLQTSATVHEREMQKAISAWVLPKFHPDRKDGSEDDPAESWSTGEITPAILQQSRRLPLEAIPAEHEYTDSHSFKYRADVGAMIYVRVEHGLKSFGGYLLGQTEHRVLQVPPFPPELKILSQGALLTMSGEKKVAVLVRDLPGVKVEIGRVQTSQLQHLVSQADGNFANPEFYGRFGPDNLTERFESKIPLPNLERGRAHYEAVDMSQYLKGDGEARRGVFLLTVSGYDPAAEAREKKEQDKNQRQPGEPVAAAGDADCGDNCAADGENGGNGGDGGDGNSQPENKIDKRLVIVTDLGLLVKKSLDGSQDIFVQSIFSGKPVDGATVEIIGKNGITLFSQTTDAGGRAHFAKIEGLSRERAPLMVMVRKGGDLSFMPLNKSDRALDMSRFDVGGANNAAVADQVSAYLFSDRGIYRPGDTFHIGIIAKSANWAGSITGLPLEAEVLDARGLTVKREKIKLPAGGFSELSYTTQDSAPTGTYNVNLYLVRDGKAGAQVGSTSVKVQEFQPDRIKVSARFSAPASEGWLNPKDLSLAVNAQNLFGTPAENRRVTAELTLTPAFPAFKQFPAYTFYDPQRAKEGYNEQLAEQTTDDKGDASFDLGLAKYAKATYRLQVLTRTYEPQGGRGVAAEAATLVSELPYMIGFKADGALNFVSRGSHRTVSIIGLDPKAQKTAVAGLTLQQIERKYVSVLTKQADGGYKYESRKKEILLKESPLAIPAAGFNLALASDTPGNFAYVIRDAQGLEFNRIEYAVAGKGNVSRSLERNAELQLTLDKKDYVPGDEIEVSIRAPYTGAGLITIERDKVFTHQWFKADTLASVQKIRLPKDFEGNGYISVQFIRDPSSDEIFMSPLSYGVVPFATSLAARTNKLTLSTPELVKPGQQLKMKLTAAQPTRVVVFAVDEGILQVARYQMADPLGFFFQKKMLEVRTSQILDLILPEFKKLLAASAPGGDAEGALGKHLNPFKRKHDKPAVYWSGIVDVNGEQEFSYQVPDTFNGSMRVMAVAVNDGAIGTAQTKALVRGDFVISPNAPLAVTPGDEFDVSVGLANNVADAGKDAAVSLTLKTSPHLQIIGNPTQTLKIGAMREGVASYRVKAVDGTQAMLGSASLNFSASLVSNSSKSAKLSTDVSVRPPVARYTQLTVGSFSGSAEVPVKRNMYPQYRKLEAGVSALPLVLADGLADYLANFPHLCTEQMVSQAIPALILSKRPEFGKSELKPATARSFDDALKVLRTRQNAEGGFGLWNASVEVDEFASIYALHLLLEGRERGETVPPDMLQKGLDYAQKLAASPGTELWQLRVRAYAAYLLTRQMVVTTPVLTSIRETLERRYPKEWQSDLAAAYLAAAYQLQKQDSLASKLIDKQVEQLVKPGKSFDYGFYYDPLIHNAQLLYLLSRHFPARVKALPQSVVIDLVKPIADGRFNTLSSAYLILAFDAYANSVGAEGLGKLAIAEVDASGKQHPLTLPNNLVPRVGFAAGTAKLRFGNDSKLTSYYAVTETGFDKTPPKEELRAGIEVLREFVGSDGKPVSAVKVGDELTVRLKFRAVGRQSVWNAALVDLMPGGFEPVLDTPSEPTAGTADGSTAQPAQSSALAGLAGAKSNWNISYADVREDRVVFYGTVGTDFSEISYRIKATNSGRFVVPPAYAESMYERGVQARSAGGQSLTVEAPGKK
ncbi:MG2 domain-containing protein [Paraherbaspirillum soli]|uniref:MG2 domain-containing protein n=1 Tax=Paraherbaspirillum soli TaxID=631222 RepID=A0ABW0M9N7_9BURK